MVNIINLNYLLLMFLYEMLSFYLNFLDFYNILHILKFFFHLIKHNNILNLLYQISYFLLIYFTIFFQHYYIFQYYLIYYHLFPNQKIHIYLFNLHFQNYNINDDFWVNLMMRILPIIYYLLHISNIYHWYLNLFFHLLYIKILLYI